MSNLKNNKNLREKIEYVTNLINIQNGLDNIDNLAYEYIYDITKYICYKKFKTIKCSSDIPEEVIQNVVFSVFHNMSKEYKRKDKLEIKSIFPYINTCVVSEICKLDRSQYIGKITYQNSYKVLHSEEDISNEYKINPTFEVEVLINILDVLHKIIKEAKFNLKRYPINIENKQLLLFPLLLSIAREDKRLINKFKIRVRSVLNDIYIDIGSPTERMK